MAKSLDVKNFRKQITKELDKKMRVKLNAITRSAAKEVMNGLVRTTRKIWCTSCCCSSILVVHTKTKQIHSR